VTEIGKGALLDSSSCGQSLQIDCLVELLVIKGGGRGLGVKGHLSWLKIAPNL